MKKQSTQGSKKSIEIDGITFHYDVEALVKEVEDERWEFEGEEGADDDEEVLDRDGINNGYSPETQDEFDKLKKNFIKQIRKLDTDSAEKLIRSGIKITKAGLMHKSARHVIIDSCIYSGYSDEYGSHKYRELVIEASSVNDKKAVLVVSEVNHQDSF